MNSLMEYAWRNTLDTARAHARAMEFEECVECCLAYLGRHLSPPSNKIVASAITPKSLRVIFPCGGNGSRWGRFLNIPKHQVNMGDGIPLIQRTINQFRSYMPDVDFTVLVKEDAMENFKNITDADLASTVMNDETPVGTEVLENMLHSRIMQSDILWIYGDVFFSESAVASIAKTTSADCRHPKFFGRKYRNQKFGNTGGEIFGVYAPLHQQPLLREYYSFIDRLYLGFPMHRRSSWEVLALLGLADKHGTGELRRPRLIDNDAEQTYNQLIRVFQERRFDPMTWVEIDDETEDFDFPCEYIERLLRTVIGVGVTLDSRK